jgi:hypothetical protein
VLSEPLSSLGAPVGITLNYWLWCLDPRSWPHLPCSTTSAVPPLVKATTGRFIAIASASTSPKGSSKLRSEEDDLQSPDRLAATPSQRLIRPIFLRRGKGFTIYGPAPDALRSYRIRSHS